MKYIDAEKLRAEIMRMHQEAVLAACGNDTDWLRSRIGTCVDILAFIDSLPEDHFRDSTKMISKELEEAADNHIRKIVDAAGHPGWDWTSRDIKDAFIAGAEWQKSQMPMPEDTVIFMKGVAEGRRLEREEREENKRKEDELPRFYGD